MPEHKHARVYFTPEVAEEILRRIVDGESLLFICGPDRAPGLPDRYTVHRHIRENKDFRLAYLLAREAQAEAISQEIMDIADGRMNPPGQAPNVGRDWLRIQARQWLCGVMAPRTHGKGSALRNEIAELEEEVQRVNEGAHLEHMGARIAAILEAVRRRKEARGDVMTGDLIVDLQRGVQGEEDHSGPTDPPCDLPDAGQIPRPED